MITACTQRHTTVACSSISLVVQRVLEAQGESKMKKPRTLYVLRDYESKGEKKTARTPAGLLWEMDDGKIELRVDLPGFPGGQLIAFREADNTTQPTAE